MSIETIMLTTFVAKYAPTNPTSHALASVVSTVRPRNWTV